MKKIIRIFTLGVLSLSIISCQSKKVKVNSESKLYTDSIYSKHLSEYRKHNVYLPKNFNKKNKYPIIYATDGSDINRKGFYFTESLEILDSLIDNKAIKPLIFIASYYNAKNSNKIFDTLEDGTKIYFPFRNIEYEEIKQTRIEDSFIADRFKNHMLYFKDELISNTESQFNQNLNKEDRFFYGSSAGAGFGISLLNTYPNKIGTYLCFSTFGGGIQSKPWKEGVKYPNLYLKYGSEEPFLKEDAEFLKSKYKELNLYSEIIEFKGGHNYKTWDKEFIKTIVELFKYE